jgi:hypothetical protein
MREYLLERAESLAMRFSHLGIGQDLAALSLADLWGVYRLLQRLANA